MPTDEAPADPAGVAGPDGHPFARLDHKPHPDPRPHHPLSDAHLREVVDPDVDLHDPAQRTETRPRQWDVLLACAVGGVLGAWARYGLGVAWPHQAGQFPWASVMVNASGALAIGVLMVVLLEFSTPHRLLRPLLGVGVLGGYTTYSTFAVDVQELLVAHRPATAGAYLVTTVVGCAAAVWLGSSATVALGSRLVARTDNGALVDDVRGGPR